jgi:hypothetical protein
MDEWIRGLPGELAYWVIEFALGAGAVWMYQNRDNMVRRRRRMVRTTTSVMGKSSGRATATVIKLPGVESEELLGTLTAIPHKAPLSLAGAAEEVFWWYWRVR